MKNYPRLNIIAILSVVLLILTGCGSDNDGVSEEIVSGQNFLQGNSVSNFDPGFESFNGRDSVNIFRNGYVGRIRSNSEIVKSGSKSIKFHRVATQEIRIPNQNHPTKIPVFGGKAYDVSIQTFMKRFRDRGFPWDMEIELKIVFYDDLGILDIFSFPRLRPSNTDQWQTIGQRFVAPFAARSMYIGIKATDPTPDTNLFLDELVVKEI